MDANYVLWHSSAVSDETNTLEKNRRVNRDTAAGMGFLPYGQREDHLCEIAKARKSYSATADMDHRANKESPSPDYRDERPIVKVAGRVMLRRLGGSLIWLQLRDHSADIQIAVSKRDCGGAAGGFGLAKKAIDLGDIVVVSGRLMKTNMGELTIWADTLDLGSKSIAPPPNKHTGLVDLEARYRQRYVDMWSRPETMLVFRLRAQLISTVRTFLEARGYIETETPILQAQAGGAAARPFMTHMNALDVDLSLRIAPELYLKRILVGGLPRVFEVSRNFRNEGVDRSHNPEFTSVEVYEAFGNYETMMELAESLVRKLATVAAEFWRNVASQRGEDAEPPSAEPPSDSSDDLRLPFGELSVDYGAPFRRVKYHDLFKQALGFGLDEIERVHAEARKRGIRCDGVDDILVINELFEEVAEATIDPAKPTFVFDYPDLLSPLTRPKADDPSIAERWDLFIGGMEIGPAYTELNDPDIQAAKFRSQLAGIDEEESTFRTMDHDFIRALKVGMPPAGGLGLGIDRLVMLLANQPSIRDVILFPFMRPIPDAEPEPSAPA